MTQSTRADDIVRWLRLVVDPGDVIELRILGVVDDPKYKPFTVSGYFDDAHLDALAQAALEWTKRAEGVYVTINRVNPGLLARAANRVIKWPKSTTADADIVRRIWLVFDLDPKRHAGVSATDAEKALARERADQLVADLTRRGWPAPIVVDSGNGHHVWYRIDLANSDGARDLVKGVLEAASALFSDDKVEVDTALFNAARIIKLPGTQARKGDSTQDRPHRWSQVISAPVSLQVVPVELLEGLAAEHQPPEPPPEAEANGQPTDTHAKSAFGDGASPEARARAYVNAPGFPASVAGQHGHDRLYHVASVLIDGFGLSYHQAMPILQAWNQARAHPPESDKQLQHKLTDAIKTHPTPSRRLLNADRSGAGRASPGSSRNGPASPGGKARARPPGDDDDDSPLALPQWPDPLGDDAYDGLVGDVVKAIAPQTEADPAGMLVQFLVAFGSVVGHKPYAQVGGQFHHTNEYVLLIGPTSSGRKGQSWAEVHPVFNGIDPNWKPATGLSSAEGVIYAVRDPVQGVNLVKEKGRVVDTQQVIVDPGVSDKRLLVLEPEFGGVLKRASREGNALFAVLRQAFDGGLLRTLVKGSPYVATDAHISLCCHITLEELLALLSAIDVANGVINRFLLVCVRRSQLLPFGGRVDPKLMASLNQRLNDAIVFARGVERVRWTNAAMQIWEAEYPRLTATRPGAFGKACGRAESHSLRLAMLFSLLDMADQIRPEHLRAALATWTFCEQSARFVFGDQSGDKDADKILEALRAAPTGMTRAEIRRNLFGDNKPSDWLKSKLAMLARSGLVQSESVQTGGRTAERWLAVAVRERDKREKPPPPPDPPPAGDPFHVNHVHVTAENVADGPFEEVDL
jgi:hypothetical protein